MYNKDWPLRQSLTDARGQEYGPSRVYVVAHLYKVVILHVHRAKAHGTRRLHVPCTTGGRHVGCHKRCTFATAIKLKTCNWKLETRVVTNCNRIETVNFAADLVSAVLSFQSHILSFRTACGCNHDITDDRQTVVTGHMSFYHSNLSRRTACNSHTGPCRLRSPPCIRIEIFGKGRPYVKSVILR
jgi:hypothetical protein